jgi:hypothetical protein
MTRDLPTGTLVKRSIWETLRRPAIVASELGAVCVTKGRTVLDDPPQLARLDVGCLPNPSAELVIAYCIGTYHDELRLTDGLGVDGIGLRLGLTDDDQLATDFNMQISVGHGSKNVLPPRSHRPRGRMLA